MRLLQTVSRPVQAFPQKSVGASPLKAASFSSGGVRVSPLRHVSLTKLATVPTSRNGQHTPSYINILDRSATTRLFASTPLVRDAVITANPRKDEAGKEMLIDITSRASTRLKDIMAKDCNPNLALRVSVQSGGCHGFQYLMSLTNIDAVSQEEDTIFEADDGSHAKVVMDEASLELLKGSKVDFTMELIGSQFKIVGNPAASSSCGCGTSFDIKET